MAATTESEQLQVAEDLEALDRAADGLVAAFAKCGEHVAQGRLAEMALIQKAMELQAKMMAQ